MSQQRSTAPPSADRPRPGRSPLDRLAADGGFSTAELLGNAALAVAALVVIWGAVQGFGLDVLEWMRGQLLAGG